MFRTIKMTPELAKKEAARLQVGIDQFIKRTETLPIPQTDTGFLRMAQAQMIDGIRRIMSSLASEYASQSAPRGKEIQYMEGLKTTKMFYNIIQNHPFIEETVRDQFTEDTYAFQYLLIERLGFHGEDPDKQARVPLQLFVGGLWWLAFDEPMLPVSPANLLFSMHVADCDCDISRHFNAQALYGLPELFGAGLANRKDCLAFFKNRLKLTVQADFSRMKDQTLPSKMKQVFFFD